MSFLIEPSNHPSGYDDMLMTPRGFKIAMQFIDSNIVLNTWCLNCHKSCNLVGKGEVYGGGNTTIAI